MISLKKTFEKMKNDENIGSNYIIAYNGNEVLFNSKLEENQFIKPNNINSEIKFEGGNLNLILPDIGKVKVTVNEEQFNLSIKGSGKLEINQEFKQSSSVQMIGKSHINGSVIITVSDDIDSITIDTIEMEKESSIFIKNMKEKYVNVYVKNIKVDIYSDAMLSNITVLNSLYLIQTGTLTFDNISLNNAKITFELSNLGKENGWNPFIQGNFNDAPNSIIFKKYSTSISDPTINEDFPFISGIFKEQNCEKWLSKIDFDNSNFDTKKCVEIENSFLLSENNQIVLSKENAKNKSNKGKIIGIVVGCVCAVIVVVIIIVVVLVKKKRVHQLSSNDNKE